MTTQHLHGLFFKIEVKTASELINVIKRIEVLTKLLVQRVWSDNGSKFTNGTIEKFLIEKGIGT